MIGAVIISHGSLSDAVLEVVHRIAGRQENILPLSNTGKDLRQMESDLREALERLSECQEVIFFSDLNGGSCSLICKRLLRENENLAMIAGYNLSMLIEFALYRSRPLAEILPLLEAKGQRGITVFRHVESGGNDDHKPLQSG